MKNLMKQILDAMEQTWTNSTGSAVASGAVVKAGDRIGVALVDIANSASGTVSFAGQFKLTAASADTWSMGAPLGWDFTNSRLTTDLSGGIVFWAVEAKTNGQTTNEVILASGMQVGRIAVINRNPTAGEDTANQLDWDTGFGKAPSFYFVYIRSSLNVPRLTATVSPLGGADAGKLRITDGGGTTMPATDFVIGIAVY